MHKRARSSGPIGAGAVGGGFPSEPPSPSPNLSPSGFGAGGGGGAGGIGAGAGTAPASGVARVAVKLLELDAAQAAVRAEEQADLEALQRRKLIEEVGAKAAEVEGLRARVAAVQARKVRGFLWSGWLVGLWLDRWG